MQPYQVAALVPFYVLGAFPTGAILAKMRGVDLKQVGSGNVGATNVSRALGTKAGLLTLFVDILKGALATGIAWGVSSSETFAAAGAVAAVLGHCFSIPGLLRGGKGVATALGAVAYLSPVTALGSIAIFAIIAVSFRMISLASVAAAVSTPIILMTSGTHPESVGAIALIAAVITFRHVANLQRMARGEEPRFGGAQHQDRSKQKAPS